LNDGLLIGGNETKLGGPAAACSIPRLLGIHKLRALAQDGSLPGVTGHRMISPFGNFTQAAASNRQEAKDMKGPYIGRFVSIAAIAGLVIWWGIRVVSGRPAEPKGPFPRPLIDAPVAAKSGRETAIFAGGCFWGVQGVFQHVKGVRKATSGYAGGTVENPYYELVSSGSTGHAESVKVDYDPAQITYGQLLTVFFSVAHDPTQKNRQGPDIGTQYRSMILFKNEEQRKIAESYLAQINRANVYERPLATEIEAFSEFYPAEAYHQSYLEKHPDDPYVAYNDLPKIARLKALYPELYQ